VTTRRAFLTAAVRVAGGVVIASCVPTTTAPAATATAGAKRGGQLVVADSQDPGTLDAKYNGTFSGRKVFRQFYDSLIDVDPKTGDVVPNLAERWETPDPRTIVLFLHKGVKFHDGTPLEADAVKYNLDRYLEADSLRRVEITALDKVTVVDSHTVRLQLKGPDVSFLSALFDRPGQIMLPGAVGKDRTDVSFKPVGSGPWKFVEWVKDDHITVQRNPDYWDKTLPYIDSIIQRSVPTSATRIVDARSGTVHIAEDVPYQDVARLRTMSDIRLSEVPGGRYYFISWNVASPYGRSKDFRQALNWLIDRDAINRVVFHGTGTVAYDPFFPGSRWHDPSYKPFTLDVARARDLIAKADVPRPLKYTVYLPGTDTAMGQMTQILQQNYKEVGVDIEIVFEEGAANTARLTRGDWTITVSAGWFGNRPDPGQYLGRNHLSSRPANFPAAVLKDPEVDRLINEAQIEPNVERRRAMYRQLAPRLNDNADYAFYVSVPDFKALNPRVKGFIHYPDWLTRYKDLWLE
jgi:peptide/nickel transport system substrate-binding protein